MLATKTLRAAEATGARSIVVGRRRRLERGPARARSQPGRPASASTSSIPRPGLCTDNGAMIGAAGARRLAAGERAGLDLGVRAAWPLARPVGAPAARRPPTPRGRGACLRRGPRCRGGRRRARAAMTRARPPIRLDPAAVRRTAARRGPARPAAASARTSWSTSTCSRRSSRRRRRARAPRARDRPGARHPDRRAAGGRRRGDGGRDRPRDGRPPARRAFDPRSLAAARPRPRRPGRPPSIEGRSSTRPSSARRAALRRGREPPVPRDEPGPAPPARWRGGRGPSAAC